MGVSDFVVTVSGDTALLQSLNSEISKYISLNAFIYRYDNEKIEFFCIIDNFFITCKILYDILSGFAYENSCLIIETKLIGREFNFKSEIEFINWIYSIHRNRILFEYSVNGAFIVPTKNYYKKKNKYKRFKKKYVALNSERE